MAKYIYSFVLTIAMVLVFPKSALPQQGMTESQTQIFKQTLAANGNINRQMHDSFWNDVPKISNGQFEPLLVWMLQDMKFAQSYQKALWQSALISYDQHEVVRTEKLANTEKVMQDHLENSLPFTKGTDDYTVFVEGFNAKAKDSYENSGRLLDAAALHQDLKAVSGQSIKLNRDMIQTVIGGLDGSFKRMELLVDPVWKGE